MFRPLEAVVRDYRSHPAAVPAVLATFLVPLAFLASTAIVASLGQLLIPFGVLAVALLAQVGRLVTAPATAVVEGLLAGETPRAALASAQDQAADRVVAAAVERALVIVGTVVVGAVVFTAALALATVGGYALSAAGLYAPQNPYTVLLFVVFGLVAVGAGIGAPLRLGTSLAGEVPEMRGPTVARSLVGERATETRTLVAFRVTPWAVLLLAVAVDLLLPISFKPLSTALLVATGVVALVVTPLAAGLERRMTASVSPPADAPPLRSLLPDRRVLVACVVLVAAVGVPTMAVRVADVHPTTATAGPASADESADAIVAAADRNIRQTGHYENASAWTYNDSTDRMEPALAFDRGWDPDDRQSILVPELPTDESVPGLGPLFVGDGTIAFGYDVPISGPVGALLVYDVGEWTVVASPGNTGTPLGDNDVGDRLEGIGVDASELPWRVLARENGTVVVGVERPERLAEPFDVDADAVAADSYVRLTVDAETGQVRTLEVHRNVTMYGERRQQRQVFRYSEWGTYDLQRPAPIRAHSPLELLWDGLGY